MQNICNISLHITYQILMTDSSERNVNKRSANVFQFSVRSSRDRRYVDDRSLINPGFSSLINIICEFNLQIYVDLKP
jgi:hypothetical protein